MYYCTPEAEATLLYFVYRIYSTVVCTLYTFNKPEIQEKLFELLLLLLVHFDSKVVTNRKIWTDRQTDKDMDRHGQTDRQTDKE